MTALLACPQRPADVRQAASVESCPETAALQEDNPTSAGG